MRTVLLHFYACAQLGHAHDREYNYACVCWRQITFGRDRAVQHNYWRGIFHFARSSHSSSVRHLPPCCQGIACAQCTRFRGGCERSPAHKCTLRGTAAAVDTAAVVHTSPRTCKSAPRTPDVNWADTDRGPCSGTPRAECTARCWRCHCAGIRARKCIPRGTESRDRRAVEASDTSAASSCISSQ